MIKITPKNKPGFFIRPVPLISISYNPIRNAKGLLGAFYNITLTGTLLPDMGSPFRIIGGGNPANIFTSFSTVPSPPREIVDTNGSMGSIIHKQNMLRELFRFDGAMYELFPANLNPEANPAIPSDSQCIIKFFPTVESIDFQEGIYINRCDYTVNLRAEVLFDNSNRVISDGLVNSTYNNFDGQDSTLTSVPNQTTTGELKDIIENRQAFDAVLNSVGGFIQDYSENWSIEVEEGKGITDTKSHVTTKPYDHSTDIISQRSYRLTRNVTVTGRTIYDPTNTQRYEAWQQAKAYIEKVVLRDKDGNVANNSSGFEQYPELNTNSNFSIFATGLLALPANNVYAGYNHLRTFSIDETAGSVTLTDTWILSSGNANEDYAMSLNRTYDSPIHKVSINGNIKGLTSVNAGSKYYGASLIQAANLQNNNTSYENAVRKFHLISNSGQYGPNCHLYKRAQSITHVPLNHVPLSIALSPNEFTGEIGYSIEYDSRPVNLVSGTLQESINCSDTYPGDVFAVIPVIGRATGPILQYIGGRTEYQRSLSIDLTFEQYWNSGQTTDAWLKIRQFGALSKPSLNEPYRSQINDIVTAYSPANEVGIRKYFISPPQETWDAKSGKYTLNITWTYELNR